MLHNIRSDLKNIGRSALHSLQHNNRPNKPIYAFSSIYFIYTAIVDRNSQLLASLIAAHRAVRLPQAASRRRSHRASSHDTSTATPCPLRPVTPCPIPRRVKVLSMPLFLPGGHGRCRRRRRPTLDLSSRHHEIRSGQTQSGLLQLHLALPSFLGCRKRTF
jgi:hypothetical protein